MQSMRYTERKEWNYSPDVFNAADTRTALKINAEYTRKMSPNRPIPTFLEVDRAGQRYDDLWHMPVGDRTVFSREIEMPVIIKSERPDWRLTKVGIVPQQKQKVYMSNLLLQEVDWFPVRGDFMVHNGYRHMIIKVVLEPEAYWHQTNVWMYVTCETIIPADGDSRPLFTGAKVVPSELSAPRLAEV